MKWRGALLFAAAASLELQAEAASELSAGDRSHLRVPRAEQFLLVSSPKEQKVAFTRITPGKTAGTMVKPLIDSGLAAPAGIAVDRKRGKLFIADPDVRKVYEYTIQLSAGELISDNRQLTVIEDIEVHWLAVDQLGDLYFTGPIGNEVMTIPLATLKMLESGQLLAANLKTESEAAAEAAKVAAANAQLESEGKPTPPPAADVTIRLLYSKGEGVPAVSAPAGIVADGIHVFWGNGGGGTTAGSIVEGARQVTATGETIRVVSENTNTVMGVTTSSNAIFYTDKTQFVYGIKKAGGEVVTITEALQQPRGLAWDGDGTVFVADKAGNMVYSFPSGRLAPAHTSRVTQLHDAFGLALISVTDSFALARASALACAALLLALA